MLPGYADVHVPFPIVQGLRTRGMDRRLRQCLLASLLSLGFIID